MSSRAALMEKQPRGALRAWTAASWALLLLACGYYAAFLLRTSFLLGGERYFCLFDDAMISMRYAKNLAHGFGLVWNPGGERVEGFTNPLWTLYLALFHLLPISPPKLSLPVQISGGLCLLGALVYVNRIALLLSRGSRFTALSAVALTGFYLPLVNWSLQGMEVSLLALLVTAAAYYQLDAQERNEFSPRPYLLLGLALLVRPDAAVALLTVLLYSLLRDRSHRRRHLCFGLAALILGLGSQTLFRVIYYDDLLPNTYYLKMTGYPVSLRILRGLYYYGIFLVHLPWWLLAFAYLPRLRPQISGANLLAALFCAQSIYSIHVGADVWEWWGGSNRHLSIAMPALFVLVALGLTRVKCWATSRLPRAHIAVGGLAAALTLACVVASNSFTPNSRAQWLLREPPLHQVDNVLNVRTAQLLREVSGGRALIALSWAGAIPYFYDGPSHDLLGKCDRKIAHQTAHVITSWNTMDAFVPGHLKWDFAHSLLELQPDLVLRDISRGRKEKEAFLKRYRSFYLGEQEVYARLDSPHLNWEVLRRLDAAEKERRNQASARPAPR